MPYSSYISSEKFATERPNDSNGQRRRIRFCAATKDVDVQDVFLTFTASAGAARVQVCKYIPDSFSKVVERWDNKGVQRRIMPAADIVTVLEKHPSPDARAVAQVIKEQLLYPTTTMVAAPRATPTTRVDEDAVEELPSTGTTTMVDNGMNAQSLLTYADRQHRVNEANSLVSSCRKMYVNRVQAEQDLLQQQQKAAAELQDVEQRAKRRRVEREIEQADHDAKMERQKKEEEMALAKVKKRYEFLLSLGEDEIARGVLKKLSETTTDSA